MVMGDKGTMFMGTRVIGRVYAITDKGGKREVQGSLQGLTQPNGLAFKDGSLYVFAINKVLSLRQDRGQARQAPGEPVELTKAYNLPDTIHHNWKYVAFGPDGKMYVQVGANCNICEINPGTHGQIRRYNADGTGMEIVARGVRNTVGFDWHPVTKELWFTDNGRDWAGNAGPEDELNRDRQGQGGRELRLPLLPRQRHSRSGRQAPESLRRRDAAGGADRAALRRPRHQVLHRRHVPEEYQNVAFIARHGSWNREQKFGYDVVIARTAGGKAKIEPFMTGLLDDREERVLRPAVLRLPDEGRLAARFRRAATAPSTASATAMRRRRRGKTA